MLETKTKILVCNAGSSSLKFSLFEAEGELLLVEGGIDWTRKPTRLVFHRTGQQEIHEELKLEKYADDVACILDDLQAGPPVVLHTLEDLQAVGHRVVHGGERYPTAVRIIPEVKRVIAELSELAPLHNPASLDGITAVEQVLPKVPQVAAFDTAFHATLSAAARTYPVPQKWTREWGMRRYGFHGLSHSYCAGRAAEIVGRRNLWLIIAHLGNGASVSAVHNGICVDTSMGFTPLEGLMMGARSGTVDPGMRVYLLRRKGLDVNELDHALNYESGLLGVSGVSSDMRQVLSELAGNPDARLAEESARASFLRKDGAEWTTDKDGPLMNLLVAEISARTGKDPGEHYHELQAEFGTPYYTRIDAPATPEQKARLAKLSPQAVGMARLAGELIRGKLTWAPGNGAPIGGLKVVTDNGWFAARPSGTENIYKIYAESFKDQDHLDAIVSEAQEIVNDVLKSFDSARQRRERRR